MTVDGAGAAAVGDRDLIEQVATLLLAGAPPGWTHLHGEFVPSAQHTMAGASLTTPTGSRPLVVPAEVLIVVAEHQRRAVAAGAPWERLIVDCHADGRLSAHAELIAPALVATRLQRRWPKRVLAAAIAVCLAAAAVVFALGWQWSTPPRVGMIAVPPPPPREQAAWSAITKWIDAENRSDTAELRKMVCGNPSPQLAALIKTFEDHGNDQRLYQPDTIVKFDDSGSTVSVTITNRVRPLSEYAKQQAASDPEGGLYTTNFTLADDSGELKVCDEGGIAQK